MQKNSFQSYCFIKDYNQLELSKLNKNINIIYRNYRKKTKIAEILKIKSFCKKKKLNLYISNDIKAALKFKLDGIYIPSFNKQINYIKYTLPKKFQILGSAHNKYEVFVKYKQGCRLIFLSPIFEVTKKKSYLNIAKFNLLTLNNKSHFIALGGINEKNIRKLSLLNIIGYAGISYFQKKTAP